MEWEGFFSVFGLAVVAVLFGAFVAFECPKMAGCPHAEFHERADLRYRRE